MKLSPNFSAVRSRYRPTDPGASTSLKQVLVQFPARESLLSLEARNNKRFQDWSRTRRGRDIDYVAMFSLQVTGCFSRPGLNGPHLNHRDDHPTT